MSPVLCALREGATPEQAQELEMDVLFETPGKPFVRWY